MGTPALSVRNEDIATQKSEMKVKLKANMFMNSLMCSRHSFVILN